MSRKKYDALMNMPIGALMERPSEFKFECPFAIKFGPTLHTRCKKPLLNHGDSHVGRGLKEFPYQELQWWRGDRREYTISDLDWTGNREEEKFYAWEEQA